MNSYRTFRIRKGFWYLVLLVVFVFGTLYLNTRAASDELATQGFPAYFLTADVSTWSGINPVDDCRSFAKMCECYIEQAEQRHLAFLLRWLYPELSPRKRLGPMVSALKNVSDNKEEAQKVMREAAKQIFKFCEDLRKFSGPQPIIWAKHERLSEKLRGNISNALEKTHEMAGKLEADLNIENALTAFRVGREAYCLLFLGRMGYPKTTYKEMVEGLLVDIKKIRYYTTELAEKIENEGDKRLLYDRDKREEFWVSVLKPLSDNNMDIVRELLFTELQRLSPEDNLE